VGISLFFSKFTDGWLEGLVDASSFTACVGIVIENDAGALNFNECENGNIGFSVALARVWFKFRTSGREGIFAGDGCGGWKFKIGDFFVR